jgi:sterol desaturase/sphingolipid hydroxylase (fatty acid hydroxylase superfamily)
MDYTFTAGEPLVRLACFAGVFLLMAAWEIAAPRRTRAARRSVRWTSNLGVVALDTLLIRIVVPTAVVGVALQAEAAHWGLLSLVSWPLWIKIAIAVVALDLTIYLQHVVFHAIPSLWRLHRMHHADLDIDVSTGVRFHPLEMLLSLFIKMVVVAGLGAPALAVLVFEILLNATSMFSHSNVRLPDRIDHIVRWIVVTPDMHRVHHSIEAMETNSNVGFNFSLWDRIFGTYRSAPAAGHLGMTVGIEQFREPRELWLDRMLTQPFREGRGPQPFNGTPSATLAKPVPNDRSSA